MDTHLQAARVMGGDEILATVSLAEAAAAVERAFLAWADGAITEPQSLASRVEDGTFHVKTCASPALFVAKTNANFPANPARGLPTIQGVVAVFGARDGRLLMLLDSPTVTNLRTAATSITAVKHLALPGARHAAIVGCGALGRIHSQALSQCLGFDDLRFLDSEPGRAARLAAWAQDTLGVAATACASLPEATAQADVVITCTSSQRAFLGLRHVAGGTMIAAVGADNDQKAELEPALLEAARVVEGGTRGELAEVIRGRSPRAGAAEIVVFRSTGIAVEDLAVCALLAEKCGLDCG